MTETCLPIVNWLKNWFTPSDEDYKYAMQVRNPSDSTYAYNPHIDDVIRVAITVTDADGNNVPNHTFTLNWSEPQSDAYSTTLTTNSSGFAYYDYTCNKFGLITFRVKDNNIQVKVGGWRVYKDTGENSNPRWIVRYDDKHTRVRLAYSSSQTIPTSATNYGTELFPSSVSYLTPTTAVMFPVYNGAMVVICQANATTMQRRTIYGTSQFNASSQYWEVEWVHQGLP